MSTDDIDRYLDQCETVLLSNHSTTTDAGPFPLLPRSDVSPIPKPTWTQYHASSISIRPASPSNSNNALQPGEGYKSYDAQDVTGELPRSYEVILKSAAGVIGVKAFDVGVVVELFERKLEGVRKERSRSRSRSRSRAGSAGRRRKGMA
jgi:RNA polymerase I-specific transcription initiation factor RRN7